MWHRLSPALARTIQAILVTTPIAAFAGGAYSWSAGRVAAFQEPYATVGQWSAVYTLSPTGGPQVAPVHMHVLPNGKILMWDLEQQQMGSTNTWLWDPSVTPSGNQITNLQHIVNTRTVLFCSGHAFMPDGRLLVAGGGHGAHQNVTHSNIFDYKTGTWTAGPDMPEGRWYPTVTALASGEMLVGSGETPLGQAVETPLVYTRSGTWRLLQPGGVPAAAPWEKWYSFLFAAPNGKVFRAGGSAGSSPRGYLDTWTGAWTQVTTARDPAKNYASAVMHEPGKVLLVGGGTGSGECGVTPGTVTTAQTIDLPASPTQWTTVAGMQNPREHHNATLLPDGTVLVTGGTNSGGSVLTPELWNPATGAWTPLAAMSRPRGYHSTAVLLPDGRVISGGTRPSVAGSTPCDEPNIEIFSPPYLFKGARPVITSMQQEVAAGQSFVITTPDTNASEASWVRLSSVTHSFNANQRFVRSAVTPVSGGVRLRAPFLNQAPPGHYMLFLLRNGVPSVSRIVRIKTGPSVADFNGDGNSDFVWRRYSGVGENAFWLLNGTAVTATPSATYQGQPVNQPDANWQIRATGDFNNDGKPDMIWQHATTGEVAVWRMNGSQLVSTGILGNAPNPNGSYWKIVGAADMNRDNKTDLVWQDPQNGAVRIWHMNNELQLDNVTLAPDYVPGSQWQVVGVADMNRDGWPDVVWQNSSTGSLASWFLTDFTVVQTPSLTPNQQTDPQWHIVGVADITENGTGDDKPDLIWQHQQTGQLAIWYMDGVAVRNGGNGAYYVFPSPWQNVPPWRLIVR